MRGAQKEARTASCRSPTKKSPTLWRSWRRTPNILKRKRLGIPRRFLFKIFGVRRQLLHSVGDFFVGDRHEAVRASFCAPRIAIDFNESVHEIHIRIVLYPV